MPPSPAPAEAIPTEPCACAVCGSADSESIATGQDYLCRTTDQEWRYVRCKACAHLYLNPRPKIEAVNRVYPPDYPTLSGRFAEKASLFSSLKDNVLLRRFASLKVAQPETMRVLDIGCGDGQLLLTIRRKYPNAELVGLDWSFAPNVAERLAKANIRTIAGVVETADLGRDHFDVIIMNQLIEHVWDPLLALTRCAQALKPGGRLSIETPNPRGYDFGWFRKGAWGGYYWPRHLNLFTPDHMGQLVEKAGLAVERRQNLLAPFIWVYSARWAAERKGWPRWVQAIFSDTNPLVLAGFAGVDLIASTFGAQTSNQKVVAVRR